MFTIGDLAERRLWGDDLAEDGRPREPLLVVDLDSPFGSVSAAAVAAEAIAGRTSVLTGVSRRALAPEIDPLVDQLDVVLAADAPDGDRRVVTGDVDALVASVAGAVELSPIAAVCLGGVLRETAVLPPALGLQAESFAYSTLLAGPEHARWLAASRRRPAKVRANTGEYVRVARTGARLDVTLADPDRRNAYSRRMRDELVDSLRLLDADDSITEAHLHGDGPAFCSGGDLDEFGTTPDPATAHLIRSARSVALLLHRHRDRIHVHVHGACVGGGVELAAFGGRVSAAPDTVLRLPELAMGLIPGAGGTVSIARRIGRWRTAYLALTGTLLDVHTAHAWGLVDDLEPATP